ncbi:MULTISPECIES: hypothetical protein [unclassified Methylobacterium]|uniref:hypothetical protein n=1 Tax=unclassified Methylobacterium TaxID=2615210 RepID=UPI00226A6DFD|nr:MULTISPECIES: hypothetical protein [unclassified Methylobacterium]
MAVSAHSPEPWHQDSARPEMVFDAVGRLVVDCDHHGLAPRQRAEANAARTAAAPDLLAMARALVEPFADVSSEFLAECADECPGDLHLIGGRGLTAHFARAILAARTAIAKAEGR